MRRMGVHMFKVTSKRHLARFAWLGVLALLLPLGVRAQQEPTNPQNDQQASEVNRQSGESSSIQTQTTPTPAPANQEVLQIGRATPLRPSMTPLRWGPLYVASVDLFESYNQLEPSDQSTPLRRSTMLLRTNIVFDHMFSPRSRFTFQYEPRFAVVNGQARSNFINQNLSFQSFYQFTPRLRMVIGDSFRYANNQHFIPEDAISVDGLSGTIVRADQFLDSASRWLGNEISVGFRYALSPRTELGATPYYGFGETAGATGPFAKGYYYGAGFSLTHAFSPTMLLGLTYQPRVTGVGAPVGNSLSQSVQATFSIKLRPTWFVNGAGGFTELSGMAGGPRYWTGSGSLGVTKTFGASSTFGLGYDRGQAFAGYVTNRVLDRGDVYYSHRWSRRISTSIGAGYYRDVGSGAPSVIGKYGVFNFQYRLAPSLTALLDYAHKFQNGVSPLLLGGTTNIYVVGIRWEPPNRQ